MKWNERVKLYKENIHVRCLWKDANIDAWEECCNHFKSYVKCIEKLEIDSQNAIISRIIYKHNNQMRRDKPFQLFKKVNQLACKYCDVKLIQNLLAYQNILMAIKSKRTSLTKDVGIPAKEFTLYVMELIIGSYHLAAKLVEACQQAFMSLDAHMRYGFFVSFNFFAIASVSRLWSVFKEVQHLLKLIFDLFKQILQDCHNSPELLIIDLEKPDNVNATKEIEDKNIGEAVLRSLEKIGQKKEIENEENIVSQNSIQKKVTGIEDVGEAVVRKRDDDNKTMANLNEIITKEEDIGEIVTMKSEFLHPDREPAKENLTETEKALLKEFNELETLQKNVLSFVNKKTEDDLVTSGKLEVNTLLNTRNVGIVKSYELKSCNQKSPFKRKLCPLKLGTLRTIRYKGLIPYPTTSLKRAFNTMHTRHVSQRSLEKISKSFKIIRKKAHNLQDVDEVRYALTQSACKQETIYLVMQLRKLLP